MSPEIKELVDKLRHDVDFVARSRVADGDWDDAYVAEINQAIRTHIQADDLVAVACWAKWFADLSASIVAWGMVIRNAELRIREAASEKKKPEQQAEA